MLMVRALASGVWRTVPQKPVREWEKTMILAAEVGRWCVNHKPVDVFPGLVVSFLESGDAEFFIAARRAVLPIIERGQAVLFAEDDDALFFVEQGLAEKMSEAEQAQVWAAVNGESDEGDEHEDPAPAPAAKAVKSKVNKAKGRGRKAA